MPHREGFAPSEVFDTGVPVAVDDEGKSEDEAQSLVRRQIEEALNWRKQHLDPEQEKATDYYNAEPFGDEQEGRSQVVTSEVRDAIQSILPSLMRVFFGSERVVEFKPRGPEDVEEAKQQTEYVNYIATEDNPGFLTFYSAFKDALVRKMGVIKWWWEDSTQVQGWEFTGLTAEQVALLRLESDTTVRLLNATEEEFIEGEVTSLDVVVQRETDKGRVRIAAIPPEEFIFSPEARSTDDALMVGHVRDMPGDQLVAMGVPEEMVERHQGKSDSSLVTNSDLSNARRIDEGLVDREQVEQDKSTRPVRFAEVYTRIDMDGDGIAELRKIQAVGESAEFFTNEIVDAAPFAVFEPDPEPHTMVGFSVADILTDLQRIKSAVTRGMLDSLTQSLNPVTEVVEGEVNMKDVLNKEVGRVIRARRPGMMREVTTPFVGGDALPVLQYLDTLKEERTGRTKAASGLDPDALQSSTRAAVSATVEAAKERTELVARIFAETGMKPLMQGILRTVVQHQDEARVVRLRNEFVRVDPRVWDADKDVVVNVALGTGLVEEKLQILQQIASEQKEQLANGSPLVGFAEYRNTLSRITELAGFRNSQEFWKPFGPQEEQAFQQQQAQNQEPSEVERLERVEMAKIQAKQQREAAQMQLKIAKLQLERAKAARELGIKEAKVDQQMVQDQTDAAIERAKLELEASTRSVDNLKKMSETRVGGE